MGLEGLLPEVMQQALNCLQAVSYDEVSLVSSKASCMYMNLGGTGVFPELLYSFLLMSGR